MTPWSRRISSILVALLTPPRLDRGLLVGLLLLITLGLLTLYSASGFDLAMVAKQASRLAMGFALLWVIARTPPHVLRYWTPWLYLLALALLVLTALMGEGRGAQRWLDFRVVRFQPSELMKLALPMMLAWYFHPRVLPPSWRHLLMAGIILGIPVALVAEQPDLGTALLIAGAGGFVIFLAGLSWWRIALLASVVLVSVPVAWQFMHEYQRERVRVLIDPEADPRGSGWHIIQSKIAVGSGGLDGKGFGQGTQSQLEFLPERHTDFILAVYAEEFGWLGVLALFSLYAFIIGRCLWIAAIARDTYGRLLAGSLGLSFSVYVVVNSGMIAGLLPVVGVPLPLISYGGTSAVSILASFGMLFSIFGHRKQWGPSAS